MSVRALITVADGVEELECVTLIDVLRRASVGPAGLWRAQAAAHDLLPSLQ